MEEISFEHEFFSLCIEFLQMREACCILGDARGGALELALAPPLAPILFA